MMATLKCDDGEQGCAYVSISTRAVVADGIMGHVVVHLSGQGVR